MKLILSRKGFDSAAGGVANPILPDGRLISLPIPDPDAPHAYGDLGEIGTLVHDLTRQKIALTDGAHLDPDVDSSVLPRHPSWRPLFGQHAAAAGHLFNRGVGEGDLFLFFSWFREVEQVEGRWRYVPGSPDQHIFFGWFQIGRALYLGRNEGRPAAWMKDHPHFFGDRGRNNVLYVAPKKLKLAPYRPNLAGAGIFPRRRDELVLTAEGENRGIWNLPGWFHPEGRASALSYHENMKRWRRTAKGTQLEAAFRGQEFVLDTADYPEARPWLLCLLKSSAGS